MKRRKKEQTGGAAAAVQVRERGGHPFAALRGYMPLGGADAALYRSVREAVPIVDAAIGKLVRLSGGFRVLCEDERAQEELGEFLRTVNVGHAQVGFNAFLDKYLDSLLTNGRAVGEIVPDAEGREIAAVLCHRVEQLALREGETALDVRFCGYDAAGRLRELPRQELVLFTPLLPEPENLYGVSLLRSMPFMAELLSRIYYAVGQNWERCGNVRYDAGVQRRDAADAQALRVPESADGPELPGHRHALHAAGREAAAHLCRSRGQADRSGQKLCP